MQFLTALFLLALASLTLRAQDAPATPPIAPAPASPDAPPPAPTPTPAASPASAPKLPANEDVIPLPPNQGPAGAPIVSESEMTAPAKLAPGAAALPDSAFTDPNGVVPDAVPSAAQPAGPSAEETQRKIKIRYKEVRVQVEKDPEVIDLLDKAKKAKNFEGERAAYREYYRLLFTKMRKVDKSLTDRCNSMEAAYMARMAQTRLEPTIPLSLPPKPEVLGN